MKNLDLSGDSAIYKLSRVFFKVFLLPFSNIKIYILNKLNKFLASYRKLWWFNGGARCNNSIVQLLVQII